MGTILKKSFVGLLAVMLVFVGLANPQTIYVNADTAVSVDAEGFRTALAKGLTSDVTLTEDVIVDGDATIDLKGHTVTLGDKSITVTSGEVTIKNGTIEGTKVALRVRNEGTAATLNIASDATVKGRQAVMILNKGSVLNTEGTLIASQPDGAAIQGNGLAQYAGVVVNVKGGVVKSVSDSNGIYFPCDGTLNITGGTVEGYTAIYAKAGTINISGGYIHATGAKDTYDAQYGAAKSTGDALVLEACGYPGNLSATITGGTFVSDYADAVAVYKENDSYNLVNDKFIEAGVFSSNPSKYLTDNAKIGEPNEDGVYGVSIDMSVAEEVDVAVGESQKINFDATSGYEVTWSSSDENIVTVKDGVVTGVAVGEAVITVKMGNLTETCKVTVYDPADNKGDDTPGLDGDNEIVDEDNTGDDNGAKDDVEDLPQTGDQVALTFWALLMAATVAGFVGLKKQSAK